MASKAPPIPPDQRAGRSRTADVKGGHVDRRDLHDGVQSHEPGDADVNLKLQGRYGNRLQNVDTVQHKVQDR
jgi:hypothetical protein